MERFCDRRLVVRPSWATTWSRTFGLVVGQFKFGLKKGQKLKGFSWVIKNDNIWTRCIMLVRVKEPPTEVRISGEGAPQLLAQLELLYPGGIEVDDDDEFVALEQTDWYRAQAAEMTAGKRLRIYRENAGLTLTRLSDLSGIPKGNLSQLEHDKRPLGRLTARKLARHLRCDYRSLL